MTATDAQIRKVFCIRNRTSGAWCKASAKRSSYPAWYINMDGFVIDRAAQDRLQGRFSIRVPDWHIVVFALTRSEDRAMLLA